MEKLTAEEIIRNKFKNKFLDLEYIEDIIESMNEYSHQETSSLKEENERLVRYLKYQNENNVKLSDQNKLQQDLLIKQESQLADKEKEIEILKSEIATHEERRIWNKDTLENTRTQLSEMAKALAETQIVLHNLNNAGRLGYEKHLIVRKQLSENDKTISNYNKSKEGGENEKE